MDFHSATDYPIGQIVEFHLRALRVLRGDYRPCACRLRLKWRSLAVTGPPQKDDDFKTSEIALFAAVIRHR